jgi:HEAT repeat protein
MIDRFASQPFDVLVEALADPDREVRQAAVFMLAIRGAEGNLRAIPHLIDMLDDPDMSVWETALAGLDRRIRAPAVDLLIDALLDTRRTVDTRGRSASALGTIGDSRALAPMLQVLQDRTQDLGVRGMVAFYMGRLRDRDAVGPLLDLLQTPDEDSMVRTHVAMALGELRDPASFEGLMAVLRDPEVGRAAASALEELCDPRAVDLLLPTSASDDAEWRLHVAGIVGKVGEPAVQPLLARLADRDSRVREVAAKGLGFTRASRAVQPLGQVALHDAEPEVRSVAVAALGYIGGEGVTNFIVQMLSDPSVRVRLSALGAVFDLAITPTPPVHLLPVVEEMAANDLGEIDGHLAVQDVAARVVRQLRSRISEGGREGA